MTAYYNEFDPFAAEWLRELIKAGHIVSGIVDERSIEDVTPNDLAGFQQCHFFAGIGGWSLALRLAEWPDDRPVWTGSCPCQPFSTAGKGTGFEDDRHLWPAWNWLIRQCRPSTIFGEQVASKATGPWFDLVQTDLERMDYAFGCVPFPAAGIGSPHLRDRAYWVADSEGGGWEKEQQNAGRMREGINSPQDETGRLSTGGGIIGLADMHIHGRNKRGDGISSTGSNGNVGDCSVIGLADCNDKGPQGRGLGRDSKSERTIGTSCVVSEELPGPTNGQWRDADWLLCRDGKWRPVRPGSFPLVNGVSNRVGRLRGYGNAIVPAQAKEFIRSYIEL